MSIITDLDEPPVDPMVLARVAKYADPDSLDNQHFIKRVEQGRTGAFIGVDNGMPALSNYLYGTHRARYYLMGADSGVGKCLAKGTKVIMYDGTLKEVQDVCNGDLLLGPDSLPRVVSGTTKGKMMMYWVHQKRGMSYRVNEDHILSLQYAQNPKWITTIKPNQGQIKKSLRKRTYKATERYEPKLVNISVKEYLCIPDKSRYKGWRPDMVVFTERKRSALDPYFMGLWLGDGTSAELAVTTVDPEVIHYLMQFAMTWDLKVKTRGTDVNSITYRLSGQQRGKNEAIKQLFGRYGLKNNKHIPADYMYGSIQDRLSLLAGLIDSDGHYSKANNHIEITQKRKELAEQIAFVARSLGFYTTCKAKKATMKRSDGSVYVSTVYRVGFCHSTSIPCKVGHKKAGIIVPPSQTTGITVVKDKVDEYYGFCVNGDGLFLLEDFTVTHNTTLADFMFVLRSWAYCKAHNIKLHLFYYSFEISMEMKKARWVSFFLKVLYNVDIPSDYILGFIPGRLVTNEHMKLIQMAYAYVEEIFESIIFVEDPVHPTRMFHAMIEGHYEKIGKVLRHKASDPKKKGTIYGFIPNPGEENSMTLIVCDTLQLCMNEQGFDIKQTMDLWSKYTIALRNLFGCSAAYIQQFNTELSSAWRGIKKGEVPRPGRIDFGDSRYTFRDADVVLGAVKPYQFDVAEFKKYDVTKLKGYFIMLYLMKNRYGHSDRQLPIFLNPIAGIPQDLPLTPSLDLAMQPFYDQAAALEKVHQLFLPKAN